MDFSINNILKGKVDQPIRLDKDNIPLILEEVKYLERLKERINDITASYADIQQNIYICSEVKAILQKELEGGESGKSDISKLNANFLGKRENLLDRIDGIAKVLFEALDEKQREVIRGDSDDEITLEALSDGLIKLDNDLFLDSLEEWEKSSPEVEDRSWVIDQLMKYPDETSAENCLDLSNKPLSSLPDLSLINPEEIRIHGDSPVSVISKLPSYIKLIIVNSNGKSMPRGTVATIRNAVRDGIVKRDVLLKDVRRAISIKAPELDKFHSEPALRSMSGKLWDCVGVNDQGILLFRYKNEEINNKFKSRYTLFPALEPTQNFMDEKQFKSVLYFLGFNYFQRTEQVDGKEELVDYALFPTIEELQNRWEQLRENGTRGLEPLKIHVSEGIATDEEFISANIENDLVISSGAEFVHDMFAHVVQTINYTIFASANYFEDKKRFNEIIKKKLKLIHEAKLRSKEEKYRIGLIKILSAMVDTVNNSGNIKMIHWFNFTPREVLKGYWVDYLRDVFSDQNNAEYIEKYSWNELCDIWQKIG